VSASGEEQMKRILVLAALAVTLAAAAPRANAATCEEGLVAIESMSRIMDLTDLEQANITALVVRAKQEGEQGKQRNCKLILADAIRFFLIKSVIQ
jgi:hypothetical protein